MRAFARNQLLPAFILLFIFSTMSQGNVLQSVKAQQSQQLPVFKTIHMDVNASYVSTLGSSLFGLKGQVQDAGQRFTLNNSNAILEVQKASGAIWYGDTARLYNESYVPTLPSNSSALSLANGFLSKHNLLPSNAYFQAFGNSITTIQYSNNTIIKKVNDLQVIYYFREPSTNITINGPGAKIKVTLGTGGAIIGLQWVWRNLESTPVGFYPIIPQNTASQLCQRDAGGTNSQVSLSIAYYADSGVVSQNYLQPHYICNGTTQTGTHAFQFRSVNIPATLFSPQVMITQPKDGSQFRQGALVNFNSSVQGGTAPYKYVWTSAQGVVLGTAPSLVVSGITVTRNGSSEASPIPYPIKLTVTDAHNQTGTDLVAINVTPATAAVFTPNSAILLALVLVGALVMLRGRRPKVNLATLLLFLLTLTAFTANAAAYHYGVEWVGAEVACDTDSANFSNAISIHPWANSFYWGEPVAWESDFKFEGAAEGGGHAHSWVDTVDLQWYCGHANGDGFLFRTSQTDGFLEYYDAGSGKWTTDSNGWGSGLKWIIIAACGPLEYTTGNGDVFDRWGPALKGLHYILAYSTTSQATVIEGSQFANYALGFIPWTVRLSWIRAAQDAQPSTTKMAYLRAGAAGSDTYNEFLPGGFFPFPTASDPFPKGYLAYFETTC